MSTLFVVIPIFNERATLDACLDRVVRAPLPQGWGQRLVLVDDCSDPAAAAAISAAAARLAGAGHSALRLRHARNHGKGAALRTGFDHVLRDADDTDLVIVQDADLEYDPDDYGALMAPLLAGSADAVVGFRWGTHRRSRGVTRRLHALGNRLLTLLSNVMTGVRVRDMECCYKVLPAPQLRRIRPWLSENRFGVEPQMVAAMARLRLRVAEVPVRYHARGFSEGKKIGLRDAFRACWVILRERLRRTPPVSAAQPTLDPAGGPAR